MNDPIRISRDQTVGHDPDCERRWTVGAGATAPAKGYRFAWASGYDRSAFVGGDPLLHVDRFGVPKDL